jgi:hypothetical protein
MTDSNQQEFNLNSVNEAATWAHLYVLIPYDESRDMGLWSKIETLRMNGNHYAASVLDKVANELIKIAVECFDTQGVTASLWPALYRFSSTTLKTKLNAAEADKNDVLIGELTCVRDQLTGILDIDRERRHEVAAAIDSEIAMDKILLRPDWSSISGDTEIDAQTGMALTHNTDPNKLNEFFKLHAMDNEIHARFRLIKKYFGSRNLIPIAECVTWAQAERWKIHDEMLKLINQTGGTNTQLTSPKNTEIVSSKSTITYAWAAKAREIAEAIYRKKSSLTVEQISDKTHKEMTDRHNSKELGMTGRGGKVPSADTIKRHALTGIKK